MLIKIPHTVKTRHFFEQVLTCFECEIKTGVLRILLIFQDGPHSAISFKWSRRELSIDVAEHRSILKNKGVVRI